MANRKPLVLVGSQLGDLQLGDVLVDPSGVPYGSGGGGGSLPLNEIGFGTGSGISSSPDFTFASTTGAFSLTPTTKQVPGNMDITATGSMIFLAPATAGTFEIMFTIFPTSANVAIALLGYVNGSEPTGFANDATVYSVTFTIDGGAPILVSGVGSALQTYNDILILFQTALPSNTGFLAFTPFLIFDVFSPTTGVTSTVTYAENGPGLGLFSSLPVGSTFTTNSPGLDGQTTFALSDPTGFPNTAALYKEKVTVDANLPFDLLFTGTQVQTVGDFITQLTSQFGVLATVSYDNVNTITITSTTIGATSLIHIDDILNSYSLFASTAGGGGTGSFTIVGPDDVTAAFPAASTFTVTGTALNDGTYTVSSSTFNLSNTIVTVVETVTDSEGPSGTAVLDFSAWLAVPPFTILSNWFNTDGQNATLTENNPGSVTIRGGNAADVNDGGLVVLMGGFSGSGNGGGINLIGGQSISGGGGSVSITTGATFGNTRLRINDVGAWLMGGSDAGLAGAVFTSNGPGTPPAWVRNSVDNTQILYGIGTAYSSSPELTYNIVDGSFVLFPASHSTPGNILLHAASGNGGSSNGGTVTIIGGNGDVSGGTINITAGSAGVTPSTAGDVNISAGTGTNSGGFETSGDINIASNPSGTGQIFNQAPTILEAVGTFSAQGSTLGNNGVKSFTDYESFSVTRPAAFTYISTATTTPGGPPVVFPFDLVDTTADSVTPLTSFPATVSSTMAFRLMVSAANSDNSGPSTEFASWHIEGAIGRGLATATTVIVGSTTSVKRDSGGIPEGTWTCTVSANTTEGGLSVTVESPSVGGITPTGVRWKLLLEMVGC